MPPPSTPPAWPDATFNAVALLFEMGSSPVRLKLLAVIASDDPSSTELMLAVKVSEPMTSKHLAKLKAAGLVQATREGMRVRHALTAKGRAFWGLVVAFGGLESG